MHDIYICIQLSININLHSKSRSPIDNAFPSIKESDGRLIKFYRSLARILPVTMMQWTIVVGFQGQTVYKTMRSY